VGFLIGEGRIPTFGRKSGQPQQALLLGFIVLDVWLVIEDEVP
jgi:hypothetical protein